MTLRGYSKRYVQLEAQYQGVKNPEEMGTTGLLAWVICQGAYFRGYNALRKATSIIRKRRGNVLGFIRTLLKMCLTEFQAERITRWAKKVKP